MPMKLSISQLKALITEVQAKPVKISRYIHDPVKFGKAVDRIIKFRDKNDAMNISSMLSELMHDSNERDCGMTPSRDVMVPKDSERSFTRGGDGGPKYAAYRKEIKDAMINHFETSPLLTRVDPRPGLKFWRA